MTREELLELVRALLAPAPAGRGPIRIEDWNTDVWTDEQRGAYERLREEAGLGGRTMGPGGSHE